VFAQTVFEKGLSESDVTTMITRNPRDLLDLHADGVRPRPVDLAWAARLNADPCQDAGPAQPTAAQAAAGQPTTTHNH
jgi:hypothetical protein